MPERIQIVDENDQPTGAATRQEAWAKGLHYRLVEILIEDENGNVLLQKRSMNKLSYPGCWTVAASGHVDEGETYEATAPRELQEEIGISTPLEYLGTFFLHMDVGDKTINQFNGVFHGTVPRDTQFTLQPEEVSEVRWISREELQKEAATSPENFTPAALETLRRYYL